VGYFTSTAIAILDSNWAAEQSVRAFSDSHKTSFWSSIKAQTSSLTIQLVRHTGCGQNFIIIIF
jgi:hypothetical protein